MSYRGTLTHVFVHRMVAEMFIPNPDNLPVVRHLDGNPNNNNVLNLAWGTSKDNWEDSVRHGTAHTAEDLEKYLEKACAVRRRPVIAISESNGSPIRFPSISDAARELNLSTGNICDCLAGRQSHAGGYTFVRAEEEGEF